MLRIRLSEPIRHTRYPEPSAARSVRIRHPRRTRDCDAIHARVRRTGSGSNHRHGSGRIPRRAGAEDFHRGCPVLARNRPGRKTRGAWSHASTGTGSRHGPTMFGSGIRRCPGRSIGQGSSYTRLRLSQLSRQ